MIVSICTITYGHESFIKDTIESVLNQKVNFDIEFIIANDNSPDDTDKIVKEYINTHPKGKSIKYFNHEKNLGMMPNFIFALKQCNGKYIALCEGDDYWTDPNKLQKQVDFLEANPDYVVCYHNALKINEKQENLGLAFPEGSIPNYNELGLKKGAWLLTLTMCFRNVLDRLPEEFMRVPNGDTFLISLLGNYGKGKFMDNISHSCYRIHGGGVWSMQNNWTKIRYHITTYKQLQGYYKKQNDKEIESHFSNMTYCSCLNLIKESYRMKNLRLFGKSWVVFFQHGEVITKFDRIALQLLRSTGKLLKVFYE